MNLIDSIKASTGFSESTVKAVISSLVASTASCLRSGEEVAIADLGVFKLVDKPERQGLNPRTKEKQVFSAIRSVRLKISSKFKALVQPDPSILQDNEDEEMDEDEAEIVSNELPPIPQELLAEQEWKVKSPAGVPVRLKTSELVGWGVNEQTPIFSLAKGTWVLAGSEPDFLAEVAKAPKTKGKKAK
jgi:DNA-binding protein HU-beta